METFQSPTTCSACGADDFLEDPIVGKDFMMGQPGEFAVFTCAACGSGTTSPFVAEEDLGSLYEGVYAPFEEYRLPRGLGWLLTLMRKIVDAYFRRFSIAAELRNQKGRLLEIGCGTGRFGQVLLDRGWSVVGVEPSPVAADHARSRGIEVHQGTMSTLPEPDQLFDAVLFRHSLEHVVFPREELRRAAALLKPGGKLLVEVPNFGCWQVKKFKENWFNISLPMHRTHFTADGLRSATEAAGLDVSKLWFTTGSLSIPASLEHKIFGRWLHRGQLSTLAITLLALLLLPITKPLDLIRGGGDNMRLVAVPK